MRHGTAMGSGIPHPIVSRVRHDPDDDEVELYPLSSIYAKVVRPYHFTSLL